MTWQDDLRRLDAELATGLITEDRYRRLRDDLLATKSSHPNPTISAQPPYRPSIPTPSANGLPNPSVSGINDLAQHTIAVSPPERHIRTNENEKVIIAPPMHWGHDPFAAHSAPLPPAWNGQQQNWRPIPPDRRIDGVQLFSVRGPRGQHKRSPILLVILIVFALVVGGVLFFVFQGGQSSPVSSSSTSAGLPDDPQTVLARFPTLPGTVVDVPATAALNAGLGLGIYDQAGMNAIASLGATNLLLGASQQESRNFAIVAVHTNAPATAAQDLLRYQQTLDAKPISMADLPQSGVAVQSVNQLGTFIRVIYNSGNWTIALSESTASSASQQAQVSDLISLAHNTFKAFPPS